MTLRWGAGLSQPLAKPWAASCFEGHCQAGRGASPAHSHSVGHLSSQGLTVLHNGRHGHVHVHMLCAPVTAENKGSLSSCGGGPAGAGSRGRTADRRAVDMETQGLKIPQVASKCPILISRLGPCSSLVRCLAKQTLPGTLPAHQRGAHPSPVSVSLPTGSPVLTCCQGWEEGLSRGLVFYGCRTPGKQRKPTCVLA